MSETSSNWDFGDSFPSIEIDTEHWKTLTVKERLIYVGKLLFQEKDLGNRMNMINYIMGNTAKVGKALVRNPEVRAYFDILENSTNMIAVSAAIGNVFKAKQKHRNIKNNEMAKMMGFPNGNYISETGLEVTNAMIESFIDIDDYHKEKYGITIDTVSSDDKNKGKDNDKDEEYMSVIKNIKMVGTLDKDIKWGMSIKSVGNAMDEDIDTTYSATCRLFYPVTGMKLHEEELKDRMQEMMYQLYIDKVSTEENYIKINGTRLDICKRTPVSEDIKNIDIPRIVRAMSKTLKENTRRGVVLVGEPGTGKTISMHKIINNFPKSLVFWVSADSINTTSGIRSVFKIFRMFKNSIVIFDDLDSAPLTNKNETTGQFLAELDGTSDLSGFFLAAVNDPSKIHMSVINRPERFDDVIHVKLPETEEEVLDIIFSASNKKGYYCKSDKSPRGKHIGNIEFTRKSKPLSTVCKDIIKSKFTHVQIAGLIKDCHTYTENGNITLPLLKEQVKSRKASIFTSNLRAVKSRLKYDEENISDEAMANLHNTGRNH